MKLNSMRFIKRWSVSKMNQEESRETLGVSHDSPPFWKPRGAWGRVYGLQLTRQHDIVPTAFLEGRHSGQKMKQCSLTFANVMAPYTSHALFSHYLRNDFVQFVWRFAATWKFARLTKERLWYLYFISFTMIYCCFFFSMVSSKVVRVGRFFRKAPY